MEGVVSISKLHLLICQIRMICKRDISSTRIRRVGSGSIELVRDEFQWVAVKTGSSCNFAWRYDACFNLEVSFVVRSEDTLNIDDRLFLVATLGGWREYPSNGVGRVIIIMVSNLATASFGSSNVETLGAVMSCNE